jgi:hypothetical protein
MFKPKILLSLHESIVSDLKESQRESIRHLEQQVADLRRLAFNATSATRIPLVTLEADAVMSQKEETIELSQEELAKIQDEEAEADRIFSGTYDHIPSEHN